MKKVFLVFLYFFFTLIVRAQNEQLAQNYFDRGEFEKAQISYEELLKSQPNNFNYFQKTIDCYQQLQQFDKADKNLQERFDKYKQSNLLVEIGYNYQLQKNQDKTNKYYSEAIDKIKKNANEVYQIAYTFEKKNLVDYALTAYQTAIEKDSKLNFNFQMALLYGQKGNVDLMIEKFLTESQNNPASLITVQNQLSRFMLEDKSITFNEVLKKALLVRVQKDQDVFWNEYLSWFYTQQKEYGKAFIQEKAIYKRDPESFSNIVNLGQLAISENDETAATEILGFVLENSKDLDLLVHAHSYLMEMKIKKALPKDYLAIDKELDDLIKEFGVSPFSFPLLKIKAHFVAFNMKKPDEAIYILNNVLKMPINDDQNATAKMELADILLYQEKFNQALLNYSQIESDQNNSPIGQEANFKIAKTSYYTGDFDWANHQLGILKSASMQLIANDALDLYMLISDQTVEDSTRVALKKFSRADFLLFQDKKEDALGAFKAILTEFKGKEIEPVTLLRIGKIYEKMQDDQQALSYYKQIIDSHKESIYIDEAEYFSAEIYNQLKDVEKAKPLYEDLIMHHEDSIYYVEAQKKYRKLRGDTVQ